MVVVVVSGGRLYGEVRRVVWRVCDVVCMGARNWHRVCCVRGHGGGDVRAHAAAKVPLVLQVRVEGDEEGAGTHHCFCRHTVWGCA